MKSRPTFKRIRYRRSKTHLSFFLLGLSPETWACLINVLLRFYFSLAVFFIESILEQNSVYQLFPPLQSVLLPRFVLFFNHVTLKLCEGLVQNVGTMLMYNNPTNGGCSISPVTFKPQQTWSIWADITIGSEQNTNAIKDEKFRSQYLHSKLFRHLRHTWAIHVYQSRVQQC